MKVRNCRFRVGLLRRLMKTDTKITISLGGSRALILLGSLVGLALNVEYKKQAVFNFGEFEGPFTAQRSSETHVFNIEHRIFSGLFLRSM